MRCVFFLLKTLYSMLHTLPVRLDVYLDLTALKSPALTFSLFDLEKNSFTLFMGLGTLIASWERRDISLRAF